MTEDQESPEAKRIQDAVKVLSEHFDSVMVFATQSTDTANGTRHWIHGAGNFFTRYGLVKSWVIGEEEKTRLDIRDTHGQ